MRGVFGDGLRNAGAYWPAFELATCNLLLQRSRNCLLMSWPLPLHAGARLGRAPPATKRRLLQEAELMTSRGQRLRRVVHDAGRHSGVEMGWSRNICRARITPCNKEHPP